MLKNKKLVCSYWEWCKNIFWNEGYSKDIINDEGRKYNSITHIHVYVVIILNVQDEQFLDFFSLLHFFTMSICYLTWFCMRVSIVTCVSLSKYAQ